VTGSVEFHAVSSDNLAYQQVQAIVVKYAKLRKTDPRSEKS
jgi:hypothetical protein